METRRHGGTLGEDLVGGKVKGALALEGERAFYFLLSGAKVVHYGNRKAFTGGNTDW